MWPKMGVEIGTLFGTTLATDWNQKNFLVRKRNILYVACKVSSKLELEQMFWLSRKYMAANVAENVEKG